MKKFELSEATKHEQELELAELVPATAPVCWFCYKGVNAGKLICPCECTNHHAQFIHIDCLETCVNTWNEHRCQYCHVRYPLELKRKSLLECYRERNTLPWLHRKVFMLLFHIFLGIIASVPGFDLLRSTFYSDESPHSWYTKPILLFLCLILILHSIYMTVSMTTDWSRRYYYKGYGSTEELKLIEQNRVFVQETEL